MLLLLWGERGGQDDEDVIPGQGIGLGQILNSLVKAIGLAEKDPTHPSICVRTDMENGMCTLDPGHLSEGKDRGWRLGCSGTSKRGLGKEVEEMDEEVGSEDRGAVRGGT